MISSPDDLAIIERMCRTIRLVRRSWRDINIQTWDEEVCRSGGSFLGSSAVLRLRRFINPITFLEFELTSDDGSAHTKIAQCAVTKKGGEIVLLERIYVLPEYDEYWPACFSKLVEEFGPHTYVYGSFWNAEAQRCFERLNHVIEQSPVERSFGVHVIATNRWKNFDEYLRAVSDSIRYDYKKALRSNLRTEVWRGWRAIGCLPQIMQCRRSVVLKLGDHFRNRRSAFIEALRTAGKLLIFGERSLVALVIADGGCVAAFVGIELGARLFHITGGTKPNRVGAGSLLMLSMIKYLFDNKVNGQLVLGACWGEREVEEYQTGSLLYKRKLRVEVLNGIYQTLVIGGAMAAPRQSITRLACRYLRPWIPLAAFASSGLSLV